MTGGPIYAGDPMVQLMREMQDRAVLLRVRTSIVDSIVESTLELDERAFWLLARLLTGHVHQWSMARDACETCGVTGLALLELEGPITRPSFCAARFNRDEPPPREVAVRPEPGPYISEQAELPPAAMEPIRTALREDTQRGRGVLNAFRMYRGVTIVSPRRWFNTDLS